ncbi:FAD-linked oxidase [Microbacterium mangrovi]|uniref:FAD-linked oxidase n=2 Tax=Microbacterium mangrovi TaxID=1348253 RepID=A0A0B1ZYU1_9MICO|nr:FAD-linked oxidase [Microbacterium mangrovi]
MLPTDAVLTGPDATAPYRQDRAFDPDAGLPLAVALPTTTADVQQIVRLAAAHGVPVVPRGAGTGLSGGASAVDGGIVLCTTRMRGLRIDPATRTVTAQPGVLNAELKAAVAAEGLWYPPDPASFEICSIGGNIATNAGGLCCVKYGVTTDYVLGAEVVLADGRVLRLGGPLIKDVAGLSLLKLFVGSEGTLGVITEVTLRLLPAPPPARIVAAWFRTIDDAAAAIAEISTSIRPSMLEYMDATCIRAVEAQLHPGLDTTAAALVLGGSDDLDPARRDVRFMMEAFTRHGAYAVTETDPETGAALAAARRAAIPAVEAEGRLLLSDVGVPLPRFGDLLDGVDAIARAHDVTIAMLAHAGDGNTHPLVLSSWDDDELAERAEAAYGEVMTLAVSLGGTITGEHGVGRMKRAWLRDQIGDDVLEVAQRIKDALDPSGILNPGTIFAPR